MADLKPLGSEKLQGDEKIKRILELAYYNPDNQSSKPHNAEYVSEAINGVYGIVKEKDGYYVKKGLTESTLDYIGGMFMKNKNRFSSYNEALKRLELLKGQEMLQEDKRYVLKVNKGGGSPATAADEGMPPMPSIDPPASGGMPPVEPAPTPEGLPADDMGGDTAPSDMESDEDEFESDFLKGIQKLTGKLGEKLRDHQDEMESDDIKYVLNSVISAVDLKKLDDGDKEEVISTLEDDVSDDEFGSDDMGEPEMPSDTTMPAPSGEESELGEMDALDELINTSFDFNDDNDKPYQDMEEVNNSGEEPSYYDTMKNSFDNEPEFTAPDPEDTDDEEDFLDDEDDQNPVIDTPEDDEENNGEICSDCRGTGVLRGKECPTCHGEGVVFADDEELPDEFDTKFTTADDLYDDDPGYDPIEMGEENLSDIQTREIELDELTDMINNTVKETLGKYFK